MTPPPSTKDDLLLALMKAHAFVLPRNAIEWRPVTDASGFPLRGSLPSLSISTATLLCTDGIAAFYLLGDDTTLFFGHLTAFVENKKEKEENSRKATGGTEKKPSKRKSDVSAALALLQGYFK